MRASTIGHVVVMQIWVKLQHEANSRVLMEKYQDHSSHRGACQFERKDEYYI